VRQPKSLLGGLVHCQTCGRSANTFGNSYRCRRHNADQKADCARPLSVSIGVLESAVKWQWATRLAALEPDSAVLHSVAELWLEKFDPAPLAERKDLQEQVDDAVARLASADEDHYVRGALDADRYRRVSSALQERIAGLNGRLRDLPELQADLGPLLDPETSLPALEAASTADARALLRIAIRRIDVEPAPKQGARFVPHERLRVTWVGE
jgi:hypothetical protein